MMYYGQYNNLELQLSHLRKSLEYMHMYLYLYIYIPVVSCVCVCKYVLAVGWMTHFQGNVQARLKVSCSIFGTEFSAGENWI